MDDDELAFLKTQAEEKEKESNVESDVENKSDSTQEKKSI